MAFRSMLVDDAPFTRGDKLLSVLCALAFVNVFAVFLFWRFSYVGINANSVSIERLERTSKIKDYLLVTWMPEDVKRKLSPDIKADLGIK